MLVHKNVSQQEANTESERARTRAVALQSSNDPHQHWTDKRDSPKKASRHTVHKNVVNPCEIQHDPRVEYLVQGARKLRHKDTVDLLT